jgi:hypothetical protein
MVFREDDLGVPRTSATRADISANWELFRGIAARDGIAAARSRKLIRMGALCLLAITFSAGLFLMVMRLRNRIPSLYSAARAEVVAIAAKFHSEPPARRAADPEPQSKSARRVARRALTRSHVTAAARERTPRPFDVYLMEGDRAVLISSMGRVMVLDMASGNLSWVRDRYLTP